MPGGEGGSEQSNPDADVGHEPGIETGELNPISTSGSVRVDDREVLDLISQMLQLINHRLKTTKEQMAKASGVKLSRINGFMNLGSQKVASISLTEIRFILGYGRRSARGAKNQFIQRELIDLCKRVVRTIYAYFELDGLSSTEDALVSHLRLDLAQQDKFAHVYCGDYALVRLSREGELVIAQLVLHPKRDDDALVRFTNNPFEAHRDVGDPVEGYIFTAGRRVFTIGAATGTAVLRCAILEHVSFPKSARHSDFVGLRLGDTQVEKEPFAHRIFLWRMPARATPYRKNGSASASIATSRQGDVLHESAAVLTGTDRQGASVLDELGVHPMIDGTIERLELAIPEIREILEILKERPPERMPWGLSIPGRQRRGD